MKRTLAFLWVLAALGVAQQVNLPKPSGPVVEVVSRCMCKRLCTGGIPLLKHLL
jgi:hypothetical protein